MAKRITGNDTPLVSVREEDKKKADWWFNRLTNRTISVAPPSTGNRPTPILPTTTKEEAKRGAFDRVFEHQGGIGQPTDRPQNEMDRRKAAAEERRLARRKARRAKKK